MGKDAVRKFVEPFLRTPKVRTLRSSIRPPRAIGDNERVDTFVLGPKKIELPVAGVFEIRNGKIAAWRDYFDLASSLQKQIGIVLTFPDRGRRRTFRLPFLSGCTSKKREDLLLAPVSGFA